jgi:hypothetical protein
MTDSTLNDFLHFLSSSSPTSTPECRLALSQEQKREKERLEKEEAYVDFAEFRDFLLLLPRRASVAEIFKCRSCASERISVDLTKQRHK